jgi:hypothetical protein
MRGAISPLAQYAFMACCLVKHRDNFTFTLPLPRWPVFCISVNIIFIISNHDFFLIAFYVLRIWPRW